MIGKCSPRLPVNTYQYAVKNGTVRVQDRMSIIGVRSLPQ
jgi:hypothetical protein